ncbi:TPA: hypothetical protein QDC20_006357 [Burkholderia aenigmatica]|uniref:hypothetical protein n=1 Tax=Burkholderia sp. AU45251 TaxID=3059204 RepID=UPI00264FF1F9|nr:hypothetical protein [Burkholderia sp. AU45251]HDR9482908.1 hypothetical protein [Burkholderia aenigmatica]MDN7520575.1 hypothetical protein [Burkholderia sp. AU45251]HDR9513855.1 hypothetical protein [Burkholderia aenigmatica]HDR9591246.1 hypothetical protein [Burkholderia aenigmatica]HDR9599228.1 hypothetical protein [Burkholderia aenigmatica]
MSVTLKEYVGSHRDAERGVMFLCAGVGALIAERVLKSLNYPGLGEACGYAFILLTLFAFYLLLRTMRIAKKEYQAAAPECVDLSRVKRIRYLWIAVGGLFVVHFVLFKTLGGEGVDRKLDASNGFDEVNYHASLTKAMSEMTAEQVEAYNWAVSDLDVRTFVGRYGKSPTARDVVLGEANRYIRLNEDKIDRLKEKLATMEPEIKDNKERRAEALRLLKTVVPRITYVGYSIKTEERRKNRDSCTDIVCSNQGNDVYPPAIWYTIDNQSDLKLVSLPCTIEYHAKGKQTTYTEKKECLKNLEPTNGEYGVTLNPGGNDNFSEGVATIAFNYEQATMPDPSSKWSELSAMPAKLPELEQLDSARSAIEKAESVKSAVRR